MEKKVRGMTKEEFIARSKTLPFGDIIDHSQVVWNGSHTKVTLIDAEYGSWECYPYNRLKGQAHPKRRAQRISGSKQMTQEEFIKRAQEVHKGENLDYSKVIYRGMHEKVTIIDPEYGEYEQEANSHLKGCVHPIRGQKKSHDSQKYSTEHFVKLAQTIWPNYDFSQVVYDGSQKKIIVICDKHGEFEAYPDALLQGKGCPRCGHSISKGEDEIYELCCNIVGKDNVIRKDRTVLENLELDILIPSHNIAIEFDGLRWHSELFKEDKNYHLNKTIKCEEQGIRLIHVFEDEWLLHKSIVEMRLRRILNDSEGFRKLYARKCIVREIKGTDAKEFLDINHIQGRTSATVYLGAYHNDELVGVMTFKKEQETTHYDLNRFATEMHTSVVGLASKMLKYFIENYHPTEIKSFLDRRWGTNNNNLYTNIGFELEDIIKPSYWYTDGQKTRLHKFGFRKDKLKKIGNFTEDLTEHEMAKKLGLNRIYDCGLFKYVWRNKKELL